ncbi:hypothetical protein AAULR_12977 [Lacticaseibacillus rhamnosus MTCC 5462]|nr:hypothetical protein AAULR_12977 [Lacticaseibacillus rhamnosus MTCC 5462]
MKWARTRIPLKLCVKGWRLPKKQNDYVLIDTAGRLQIDENS